MKLDKGSDFIGRDALLRARGQPLRKKLLTVVFDDPAAYAWGGETLAIDGQPVGELSSVGWSPRAGACVALGYARGAAALQEHHGTLVSIDLWGEPVPAHDVQPEELDIARAIAAIERDTTLTIRRPRRSWAGLRSFAPDGELVVGFDVQAAGFFWLAGQGGYGVQSAEGSSRLARALLLGQPLTDDLKPIDLAALSPARLQR